MHTYVCTRDIHEPEGMCEKQGHGQQDYALQFVRILQTICWFWRYVVGVFTVWRSGLVGELEVQPRTCHTFMHNVNILPCYQLCGRVDIITLWGTWKLFSLPVNIFARFSWVGQVNVSGWKKKDEKDEEIEDEKNRLVWSWKTCTLEREGALKLTSFQDDPKITTDFM